MASKTVAADLRPEFATVRMVHDQVISIVDPLYYRVSQSVPGCLKGRVVLKGQISKEA